MSLFKMIIVTSKANHTLNYSDGERATTNFMTLHEARAKHVDDLTEVRSMSQRLMANKERYLLLHDDYGASVSLNLSEVITAQCGSVEEELKASCEQAHLQMYCELDKAERINNDPRLQEAQRRAAAASKFLKPV